MHSFSRRDILRGAAVLGSAPLIAAQQTPTFSTDVKVVNVLATVRNKTGALIGNLGQDDFVLAEDNRPQSIKYFLRESNLPLTLGLMVDTSGSQVRVLDAERGASLRFLDHIFREGQDHVFIMQFDTSVQMKQPLTSSIRMLDDAMAYVNSETRRQIQLQGGAGTLLYDAVIKACEDTMKKQTGRKGLIVLSDGVDFGSDGTLQEAVDAALRADTVVYSILYSDPNAYGPLGSGHDGRRVMERLADESGGDFFEVGKKQTVDQMFEILEEELRNQYSIGYVSDKPVKISEFRNIELTAKQKSLQVRARRRYWAQR